MLSKDGQEIGKYYENLYKRIVDATQDLSILQYEEIKKNIEEAIYGERKLVGIEG